jgi:thioredoxin reductase (NADPH)
MTHRKLIIIGSGPAGYTAALYAARANLAPLLFEGAQPGGQLTITTDVENYPGFPDGLMGPDMMVLFKKQAERFGTECILGEVDKVDFSQRPFRLQAGGEQCTADAVIIATGATAKLLGIESETRLMGHGVSACATCDGFFFKNKEVVVVGGGDTAMEEANFLTKYGSKVTIVHRRNELRASKIMQQRSFGNPKIAFAWSSEITQAIGKEFLEAVKVKSFETGEESVHPAAGLFFAIGHKPNTEFLGGQLELDDTGYVVTKPGTTQTNVAGVFAAGDVQDKKWRQAITAAGTGCMAALEVEHFLSSHPI